MAAGSAGILAGKGNSAYYSMVGETMKAIICLLLALLLSCAPDEKKPGDKDDPGGIEKPPQEGRP